MGLSVGTCLGPHEILAPLGAGGMGEVYRARDTRLDRIVAIKVLRTHLAADPDRRQRFEREARLISQLNHPHICTLFDVGHHEPSIGSEHAVDYLVSTSKDRRWPSVWNGCKAVPCRSRRR
jgi:serine/threonine protein kinase